MVFKAIERFFICHPLIEIKVLIYNKFQFSFCGGTLMSRNDIPQACSFVLKCYTFIVIDRS